MKKMSGLILMSLGTMIGLASLYIGISLLFSQSVYGGIAGISANIIVDIFFILLAGVFIFFAVRWGTLHEKRILAILFFIGSIAFLVLSINMFFRFSISFPLPSKDWLMSMASSRAHIIGEFPVIDDMLILQGRITTSGTATVALIASAILAWFGKSWFKNQSNPETQMR